MKAIGKIVPIRLKILSKLAVADKEDVVQQPPVATTTVFPKNSNPLSPLSPKGFVRRANTEMNQKMSSIGELQNALLMSPTTPLNESWICSEESDLDTEYSEYDDTEDMHDDEDVQTGFEAENASKKVKWE